jgi:hypothetical protein
LLEIRVFAVRGDEMDIDYVELETFVPASVVVPLELKTKTTKTP